jgi:hypothetical protein
VKVLIEGVIALSTSNSINCALNGQDFRKFANVSLIRLECDEKIACENGVSYTGSKYCHNLKPYVLKTSAESIIPIVDKLRPLNLTVYPFASDKDLVLSLEQQIVEQKAQIKKSKETGKQLLTIGNWEISPITGVVLISGFILVLVMVIIPFFLIYKCKKHDSKACGPIMQMNSVAQPPPSNTSFVSGYSASLDDLLKAFQKKKSRM